MGARRSRGCGALALIMPEASEAGGGTQLEKLCALALGNGECLMITLLGRGLIAGGEQQIASYAMQVGLIAPLIGGRNDLRSLGEVIRR